MIKRLVRYDRLHDRIDQHVRVMRLGDKQQVQQQQQQQQHIMATQSFQITASVYVFIFACRKLNLIAKSKL